MKHWIKSTTLLFGLISGIITLESCFKNPEINIPNACSRYVFSDPFLQHTQFDSGSYWIYKDETNQLLDSIFLISQTISPDTGCAPGSQTFFQSGRQEFYIAHYSKDPETGELTLILDETLPVFSTTAERYSLYNSQDYINQPYFGLFGTGFFYEDPSADEFDFETFDSQVINGEIYNDVINYYHIQRPFAFYWAPGVGLVRKIYLSDFEGEEKEYTFELVRYHIE